MAYGVHLRDRIKRHFPFLSPWYQAVRYREHVPPFRRRYALGHLHEEIKRIVGGQRGGFFIEAGALDGLYQSNTAYLESYLGWSGLLIEPLAPKIIECVRNRPKAQVVHCGLVGFGYDKPYIEVCHLDAMSVATHTSRVDVEKRVEEQRQYGARHLGLRFLAPARTLDSVLAEHGYPHVDLFSLDVEGAELEVLSGIDFARTRIRNLIVETDDGTSIDALLRANGYRLEKQLTFHDYHYVPSAR